MARSWYYVDRNDQEIGPVDSQEIRSRVSDGTITPTTQIWRDDLPDWVAAGQIKKLFEGKPHRISEPASPLGRRQRESASEEEAWENDLAEVTEDSGKRSSGDPFEFVDDTGQSMRSFRRPEPRQTQSADDDDTDWGTGGSPATLAGTDYAPPVLRLVARFLDGLGITVLGFVVLGAMFGAIGAAKGNDDTAAIILLVGLLAFSVLCLVIQFVVIPMQNAGPHQASWGKRVVGIIVTDTNGERATFGATLGRELAQVVIGFVPFLPLLDILWPFFDDSKQCLHDKMANTLVLKKG